MIETISLFGKTISLYFLFWYLSVIFTLIVGAFLRKYYGFSFSRMIIYVLFDLVLACLFIVLVSHIVGGGQSMGFNFVRIVWNAPLYFVLLAFIFGEPLGKLSDFYAVIAGFMAGFSHLGCIFTGCCHGYPAQWGIYSNAAGMVCFPIQPIESIVNIMIGIILYGMAKKKIQQGMLYPWYMVMFGGTRFLLEFLRDNHKVWGNVSELAIHALVALIIGLSILILEKCFDKKEHRNEKI